RTRWAWSRASGETLGARWSGVKRRGQRVAAGFHDGEHQGEVVEELEQLGQPGALALDDEGARCQRGLERQLAQDEAIQGGTSEAPRRVRARELAVRSVGEGRAREGERVALLGVGEGPVDGEGAPLRALSVQAHREIVEEEIERHGAYHVAR